MRACAAVTLVALLAGCSGERGSTVTPEDLSYDSWTAEVGRTFAASFLAEPFAEGTVHVVAEERGEMKTYVLVPCRGGTHVCAGGLRGRAGHVTRGPDHVAVTGAYPGRTFLLAPGGSGALLRGGIQTPLAWE